MKKTYKEINNVFFFMQCFFFFLLNRSRTKIFQEPYKLIPKLQTKIKKKDIVMVNILLGNRTPIHVEQFIKSRSNIFPAYIPDCLLLERFFLPIKEIACSWFWKCNSLVFISRAEFAFAFFCKVQTYKKKL